MVVRAVHFDFLSWLAYLFVWPVSGVTLASTPTFFRKSEHPAVILTLAMVSEPLEVWEENPDVVASPVGIEEGKKKRKNVSVSLTWSNWRQYYSGEKELSEFKDIDGSPPTVGIKLLRQQATDGESWKWQCDIRIKNRSYTLATKKNHNKQKQYKYNIIVSNLRDDKDWPWHIKLTDPESNKFTNPEPEFKLSAIYGKSSSSYPVTLEFVDTKYPQQQWDHATDFLT